MKADEIGGCVYVLFHKKWGKTLVNGQLKSRLWWETRLNTLINEPAITITEDLLWDGHPVDYPIPYEKEMGL